ncbi:helix-turn-helix transcriptional regulator [Nocardia brevicatena]|uniref:helix-turn-helix transcriptional regulator n=1 Tax=Nocardia brevicatena TaxID=37327 RepID=UPI0002FADC2F|nr:WYL domain-containing protein [Nocardia brevicatena]
MRADRLVATLLLMQTRGRVTAAEIAAELEVSVATARRDLEALSIAGVPVYPQAGRCGGWSLIGGARTDLSGLTAGEARALFLLTGPSAGAVPEARSALRKLLRALPATFRGEAEAAADVVVIDPAGWGRTGRELPETVRQLQQAVVRRRRVVLRYRGRAVAASERVVDPWGLVDKDAIWYLVAGTENGRRTYRVDLILHVELTEQPLHRPADLDLPAVWAEIVAEMEQRRATAAATALISERLLPILRDRQGRHCEVLGPASDGRIRVRLTAHTPRAIAEQLAGWGADIEVIEPAAVRDELAALGAALVDRYGRL